MLRDVRVTGLGTGSYTKEDARAMLRDLRDRAGVRAPEQSRDQKLALLRSAGVTIVREGAG